MATHNVTIKQYNSGAWDTIYVKTTAENIIAGILADARIPNLNASKINAGTFDPARIPNLDASKVNAGTFDPARIPNINANKITEGTIDVNRLPAIALTNTVVSTTLAAFLTLYAADPTSMQQGDVLILTTDGKTYIHNGGTAGTAADFTLLSTPTAAVASVAGKTGVVTLVKGDVGLGNVDNTSDANKPVSTAQQTALNAKADKVSITGATKTKITYNSQGIVTGGADLLPADVPNLDAAKITTGEFAVARIPTLTISKVSGLQTALDSKQGLVTVFPDVNIGSFPVYEGAIVMTT